MKPFHPSRILAGAMLVAACSMPAFAAPPDTIEVTDVTAMQSEGTLLIDVREVAEYAQEHAPGATLIPLGELAGRLAEIAAYTDKPVALICRSGNRSGKALKLLQAAGFSQAVNVEGGMIAWKKAGLAVITGAAPK